MILNSAQFTFTAGLQEYIMMGLYFLILIIIGFYAYKQSTSDLSGYMLGGRNIGPWVTALSAGASDMSGWMLMGLPGSMYSVGLSSLWIAIGLTIGAYINYWVVAPRLRVYSEVSNDSITLPDFFENRFKDDQHILKIVSGVVIVIFFAVYTASGMVSGGKLFESAFNVPYHWGLFVTAGVVVIYTFFGGYLAVSLTDFFQGTIMFIAIFLIPIVAWLNLTGQGVEPFVKIEELGNAADINYLSFVGGVSLITILSNLAWGFGYFGQPHIIVRFMSIKSHKIVPKARRIGIIWMGISLLGATITGLLGIAFTDATANSVSDPETILILMSQVLFHPLIGGFFLAAILAAIMSTISSQLLVTSSSLVQDFYKIMRRKTLSNESKTKEELDQHFVLLGRLSVILVAIVAIIIAWDDESVILNIVANAWAGFGAAFGPLVVLSLHWKGLTRSGAVSSIIAGAATVIIWIAAGTFGTGLYEIIPGVIVSTLVAVIVSKMTKGTGITKEMEAEFDETTDILKNNR
ncbi:sodium/proline symporter PutP [Salinicoccus jeotgali]|uniref:Sodium/proline symporter n=1 Tax=Salinicoccus jeotgali TaxID=381634 RepID=A0ABP7E3I1_9STAP